MIVTKYLQRIGYSGPLVPSPETLRGLHRAHLYTVPFENLSIHSGERIQLNMAWLFNKIVTRRRGGFCYELNSLFGWLLTELGFQVTMLSAQVAHSDGEFGPEFDHMVLQVTLDDPWLADVGFGDSYLEPIRLDLRETQLDPAGKFRVAVQENGLVLQEWVDEKFVTQHLFSLTPRALADFEEMCYFHQTSPDSPFTRKIVCSKPIPAGRFTLSETHQIITRNGIKEETELTQNKLEQILRDEFGIQGVKLNFPLPRI